MSKENSLQTDTSVKDSSQIKDKSTSTSFKGSSISYSGVPQLTPQELIDMDMGSGRISLCQKL